jgi:hypothetical protein
LCLLALLVPASARAEWRRLETPNFIVIGDAGERDLRNVAVRFEGFRETLGRVLGTSATATAVPTVVVVFPHDRAFTPYKPLFNGKPVAVAGAFYGGRDFNYITLLNDDRPGALEVLFHEYAHLMVSNVAMNLPVWLSEGLAEYYSTYEYRRDGREALIGKPIDRHLQLLGEKTLLPLRELITVDDDSPLYNEGERRSLFYAQSWALTHMLLLGEPSRLQELSVFIRAVQSGTPPDAAWRQAFGSEDIERALAQYVRRVSLKAYRYTFTEGLSRLNPSAESLPAPDAAAFLAGLRLQQDRLDDAATLAAQVLERDARHAHARATRARIAIARGDLDAAARELVGLGPTEDWFAAYAAGTALTELIDRGAHVAPEQPVAARSLLAGVGRAREVPNALANLAVLDALAPSGASAAGRAAIERARALAPGREDYVLVHARVLAETGEFELARAVLGSLLAPGYSEQVRSSARTWMDTVVRMEEHRLRAALPEPGEPPREAASTAAGASGGAFALYRIVGTGERRLEGTLERIACPPNPPATVHVRTEAGLEAFEATALEDVEFITYRDDLTGSVTCGSMRTPMRVYVTWREGKTPGTRRVVAIEFLPK